MRRIVLLFVALLSSGTQPARAADVILTSVRDNTLYTPTPELTSNGGGATFSAGNNGLDQPRRGLVLFDLAAIPPGAAITSATLRLTLARAASGDIARTVSLHRTLASWGENQESDAGTQSGSGAGAPALPGDATWLARFHQQSLDWITPGGDFVAAPSASTVVAAQPGLFLWSGPGVLDDVRAWHETPGENFGWLVRGDETMDRTNRQFATREATPTTAVPTLFVTFFEQNIVAITREPGGGFRLHGTGLPGRTYTIEATANLGAPAWQPIGTRTADAQGAYTFLDTPTPATATRFYRAVFP